MSKGPMTPTKYLHLELSFKLSEFTALSDADKAWYRAAAIEEMRLLGIAVKEM